jgi:hypothetical protein
MPSSKNKKNNLAGDPFTAVPDFGREKHMLELNSLLLIISRIISVVVNYF